MSNEKQESVASNAAAMREALEAVHRMLKLVYENAVEFIQPRLADEIIHAGSVIESALSAPPRNCDMYATMKTRLTRIEQIRRGQLSDMVRGYSPPRQSRKEKPMEVNNKMRKALTDIVEYLNGKVERASKCSRCQYNGKSFRGEPYCLHEDCGISYCDKKARDKAMYLLKRFKLQEALAEPIRNCHVGTADEQLERYGLFCQNKCPICENRHSCYICGERRRMKCMMEWQQMPYEKGGAK